MKILFYFYLLRSIEMASQVIDLAAELATDLASELIAGFAEFATSLAADHFVIPDIEIAGNSPALANGLMAREHAFQDE